MHGEGETKDEDLLVLLVQQGDIAAFERLLLRLYRPMRRYVASMVGEQMAEDLLQEIALKIYQQIRFLGEPKAFRAWAYRIATRAAFAHLKREKQWRQVQADPAVAIALSASAPKPEEMDSDLLGMVAALSPASRAVLLLHYQQHRSLEETAAILNIPLGTAKSLLSYGVAQLRTLLKEKNVDEQPR